MKSSCKSCCKVTKPNPFSQSFAIIFWGASTVRRLELEAVRVETGSHVGKLPPFWEKPPCEKPMSQKESLDKNDMFQTGKTHWGDKLRPSFPRDASFPSCFDDRRGYKADLTSAASICRESRRVTGIPGQKSTRAQPEFQD